MASAVTVEVSGSEGLWRLAKRADRAVVWDDGAVGCAEERERRVCAVVVVGDVAGATVDADGVTRGRSCIGIGSGVGGSGGVSRI